ncbi:MAG: ArsR family transcriptional regulator [Clostridiales bacterium]|nr:MAG: ArsR family transcriptional regulator [Clostridiales bacterium]
MDDVKMIHSITEPTRFRILRLLFEHHYCVRALAKKLDISESAVSQHMRILRECGIVHGEKMGYQVHYRIERERLTRLFDGMAERLCAYPKGGKVTEQCTCEFMPECLCRGKRA